MSLLGELAYALITSSHRSIATIIPDVVFEEASRDELIITQHPVESGATIADHAFKRPAELEMRCGFSNSTAGYEGYTRDVYNELRALQDSRQPFSVSTGKRNYSRMLLRSLAVVTDPTSENALMVAAGFQEIVIVSTKTTGTGTNTTSAGTAAEGQTSPATTGSTIDTGEKQGVDAGGTSFASAFNPGTYNAGGDLGNSGGLNVSGGVENGNFSSLDGLSPGPTTEVGPMQIEAIDGVPVDSGIGVEASPYNVFGA